MGNMKEFKVIATIELRAEKIIKADDGVDAYTQANGINVEEWLDYVTHESIEDVEVHLAKK